MTLVKTPLDMNKIEEYILFSSKEPRTIDDALEFSNQILSRLIKDFSIKNSSLLRFAYSYFIPKEESTFFTPQTVLQKGTMALTSENIARLLSEKYAIQLPVFDQMISEETPVTIYEEPELDLLLPGVTDNQIRIGSLTSITRVTGLGYGSVKILQKWYSLEKTLTPRFAHNIAASLTAKLDNVDKRVANFEKTPHILPVAYFTKFNENN